jgi:WD40 repeat protein
MIKSIVIDSEDIDSTLEIYSDLGLWIQGPISPIMSLALNSFESLLYSASYEGKICIWSLQTYHLIKNIQAHNSEVSKILITRNNSRLISCSTDCYIKIWKAKSLKLLSSFTCNYRVYCMVFRETDNFLHIGSRHGHLMSWNLFDCKDKRDKIIGKREIWTLCLPRNESFLIVGSFDKNVYFVDNSSYQVFNTIAHDSPVTSVCITDDMQKVITGTLEENIRVFAYPTLELIKVLYGHSDNIRLLSLSNNNLALYSASTDGTVKTWSLTRYTEQSTVFTYMPFINSLVVSETVIAVSACAEKKIKMWDRKTEIPLAEFSAHLNQIRFVGINADEKYLFSQDTDVFKVWDLENKRLMLNIKKKNYTITSAEIQGNLLVMCEKHTICYIANLNNYLAKQKTK